MFTMYLLTPPPPKKKKIQTVALPALYNIRVYLQNPELKLLFIAEYTEERNRYNVSYYSWLSTTLILNTSNKLFFFQLILSLTYSG